MWLKYHKIEKKEIGLIFILLVVLFTCCRSEHKGYKKTKHNIYYKLISIGETEKTPEPGDYITIDLEYLTLSDSLFFKARRKFKITKPQFEGSVDECFLMLSEKERAKFIISADNFFNKTLQAPLPKFLDQGDKFIIDVSMIEIQTENEYNKEKEAFLKWINDFGEYELVKLKHYIEESKLDVEPTSSGLFHLKVVEGNGIKVATGDTIVVHYEGKFLNGKFFDSTKKRKEPFQFIYGQQWQVIKGLEEAIGMMEEGEKSIFILPSEMAFGETGSSTGIIPPFTSLIFEVELLNVKKTKNK